VRYAYDGRGEFNSKVARLSDEDRRDAEGAEGGRYKGCGKCERAVPIGDWHSRVATEAVARQSGDWRSWVLRARLATNFV
jgi:hypothetical protein